MRARPRIGDRLVAWADLNPLAGFLGSSQPRSTGTVSIISGGLAGVSVGSGVRVGPGASIRLGTGAGAAIPLVAAAGHLVVLDLPGFWTGQPMSSTVASTSRRQLPRGNPGVGIAAFATGQEDRPCSPGLPSRPPGPPPLDSSSFPPPHPRS